MPEINDSAMAPPAKPAVRSFELDGRFFWREVGEGIKGFFLPFAGLYAALTGKEVVFRNEPAE